jgi:hypothetical protein
VSGIFDGSIFDSAIFDTGGAPVVDAGIATHGGMFVWADEVDAQRRQAELVQARRALALLMEIDTLDLLGVI